MKTRAAVAFEPGAPLRIVDLDLEQPKAGEVLVEIKATGLCHTDLLAMSGDFPVIPPEKFPFVPGHEGAGVVLEVGEGVTRFQPGDHVVPLYAPHCGACPECLHVKPGFCEIEKTTEVGTVMTDGTTRFSFEGNPVHHSIFCSTFANHIVTPQAALAKIRKDVPFELACYVGCGVTTGVGAVLNEAKVRPGASVAVFGLGGIGFNVIQGAKLAGASQIIGLDINPDREALARDFGMTDFVNPSLVDDVIATLHDMTNGGVEYCFECVGKASVAAQAIRSAHPARGEVVLIGASGPEESLTLHPNELVLGPTVHGTNFGSAIGPRDVPKYLDWYVEGKLKIDEMITHRLTLDQINEGFDLMLSGNSIRSVVVY